MCPCQLLTSWARAALPAQQVQHEHASQRATCPHEDGSWAQQGTKVSPGLQEKLRRGGTRKTSLTAELNGWPPNKNRRESHFPTFPVSINFDPTGNKQKKKKPTHKKPPTPQKTNQKISPSHNWKCSCCPQQSGPRG